MHELIPILSFFLTGTMILFCRSILVKIVLFLNFLLFINPFFIDDIFDITHPKMLFDKHTIEKSMLYFNLYTIFMVFSFELFFKKYLAKNIFKGIRKLIDSHSRDGHQVYVITNSQNFKIQYLKKGLK